MTSSDDLILAQDPSNCAHTLGQGLTAQYIVLCATVAVPCPPDSADVCVALDIPTPVPSGGLDARTLPFRGAEVARALSHGTLVVFPEDTHVQRGEITFCAAAIMTAFRNDPTAPVDPACVAAMPNGVSLCPMAR